MNLNGKQVLMILAGAALSVVVVKVYNTTIGPMVMSAFSGFMPRPAQTNTTPAA